MKNILLILQLIPTIIGIITSLETAIPIAGQGKVKLDLIKNFLGITSDTLNEIWPAIEKIISVFVTTANSIGVFKTKIEK